MKFTSLLLSSLLAGNVAAFVVPTTIKATTMTSTSAVFSNNDDNNNNNKNGLWGEPPQKEGEDSKDRSKALPFAARPKLLDGSLAADAGFE
jgi:hypothetical protein